MEHTSPNALPDAAPEVLTSSTNLSISPATWAAAGAVAKWVGEKVGGGIAGAIGGSIFSSVMDAIGMGGPDLVGKLDLISEQLVQVQKTLDRLVEMTAEILKQLGELKDFMERSLKVEALVAAMTRIDVAYGSPTSESLLVASGSDGAISLRLLTEKMPHFPGVTPQELEAKAKAFASYVSDIPGCVETINVILAKAAFGQTSLLNHWARELSQQVKGGKIGREDAYLVLEGYFLNAISVQLKGVSVHCVALGTERLGKAFIKEYLEDTFAKTMANETAAYLEAVEIMVFSSLPPTMAVGLYPALDDVREFPKHVDEILLRADLVCAALNLVGNKPGSDGTLSPSIQAAIKGIYGRALYRPSDLNNGQPPAFGLKGYTAQAGALVRKVPLPCLDLTQNAAREPVLSDLSNCSAFVAHYRWAFATPEPAVGAPIDPGMRGGVRPALYPVFGADQPQVLAAGVLDVNPIYCALRPGAEFPYEYKPLPPGYDDLTVKDQRFDKYRHPLMNAQQIAYEVSYTVFNIYRANAKYRGEVNIKLFRYDGAPAKVRLTAHLLSRLKSDTRKDHNGGTAFRNPYSLLAHLRLMLPDGSKRKFYTSTEEFGYNKPLDMEGSAAYSAFERPYDAYYMGGFGIDIDLKPGVYGLQLDNEIYYPGAPKRSEGWNCTGLGFQLRHVTLERAGG